MTKSAGNCGFGHIYLRESYWKTSFFAQVLVSSLTDLNIKSASEFDLRDQINWKFTVLVTIEIN